MKTRRFLIIIFVFGIIHGFFTGCSVYGEAKPASSFATTPNAAPTISATIKDSTNTPLPSNEPVITDGILYTNAKLGFSLMFPESWRGKYIITESEAMITVNHKFKNDEAKFFTVSIWDAKKWEKENTPAGLPIKKIGAKNDKVYVAAWRMDQPYGTMEGEYKEASDEFDSMYKQVKTILNTFKLIDK